MQNSLIVKQYECINFDANLHFSIGTGWFRIIETWARWNFAIFSANSVTDTPFWRINRNASPAINGVSIATSILDSVFFPTFSAIPGLVWKMTFYSYSNSKRKFCYIVWAAIFWFYPYVIFLLAFVQTFLPGFVLSLHFHHIMSYNYCPSSTLIVSWKSF